jgi:hypothetical protein
MRGYRERVTSSSLIPGTAHSARRPLYGQVQDALWPLYAVQMLFGGPPSNFSAC